MNDRESAMAMMLQTVKDKGNEKEKADAIPKKSKRGERNVKEAGRMDADPTTWGEEAANTNAGRKTFDDKVETNTTEPTTFDKNVMKKEAVTATFDEQAPSEEVETKNK